MGGKIYLDNEYDSGVPGFPGTRLVIDLHQSRVAPPVDTSHFAFAGEESVADGSTGSSRRQSETLELPEELSVLFVDDDAILRKLFCRTVRKVAPGWSFREAASGETALQLVETERFDIIFMDQYMASVEKQLLGTETVAALRAKGIDCRICGLSANDLKTEFLQAGANTFLMKPFPCDKDKLKATLITVLYEAPPRIQ